MSLSRVSVAVLGLVYNVTSIVILSQGTLPAGVSVAVLGLVYNVTSIVILSQGTLPSGCTVSTCLCHVGLKCHCVCVTVTVLRSVYCVTSYDNSNKNESISRLLFHVTHAQLC